MVLRRPLVILCLFALACGQAFGQAPVASSLQGLSIAGQALQSLAGGTVLADVSIQANALYTSGSNQEAGTGTLIASGNAHSVETLSFSDGTGWKQIRDGYQGAVVNADGTATAMATHNCFIDGNWFFPALSLQALASDPTLVINLVGQQVYEGQQVYHLTLFHNITTNTLPSVAAMIQATSAMDLYLNSTTLQPIAVDFNEHPDTDAYTNFPTEIRFGSYQQFNGIWVPTVIQKYEFGMLKLNLTVASAVVNSGISATTFTLPTIASAGGAQ